MIDTSNYTLDTPILVSIKERGVWIPEINGYPPYEGYLSIEKIIQLLNRNIDIEFKKQGPEKEISKKIEDIMLQYEERKAKILEKTGVEVGSNIDTALDNIQNLNDSGVKTKKEVDEETANKIFDYSVQTERFVKHLSNVEFTSNLLDESPANLDAEERLKRAETERKSQESVRIQRKENLNELQLQTEAIKRMLQDAQYIRDETPMQDLDLSESIMGYHEPVTNPFYLKKKPKA